ncbi:hypothetical protein NPIL_88421 [Nephila pilipes]|uniref:Uncharacterized protein n=1 Tax=Nephila pilipes TaxID=299642 RepID=A0A8X6NPX6_NEPPI|nr:hypothetical protein NPIL_88421 [Nephila pilipes]
MMCKSLYMQSTCWSENCGQPPLDEERPLQLPWHECKVTTTTTTPLAIDTRPRLSLAIGAASAHGKYACATGVRSATRAKFCAAAWHVLLQSGSAVQRRCSGVAGRQRRGSVLRARCAAARLPRVGAAGQAGAAKYGRARYGRRISSNEWKF